ncbi:MAG: peptidoglycan DD-metalloendopeptidase family protein [Cellvibrionales bacterium]|nr:peptidoglycan DD-metalloendopeptidase family protein [Cellvibrionales bacterium]
MAKNRHATLTAHKKPTPQWRNLHTRALNLLLKLSKIEAAILAFAVCSVALGLGNSLQSNSSVPSIEEVIETSNTDNLKSPSNTNRKTIALTLPDANSPITASKPASKQAAFYTQAKFTADSDIAKSDINQAIQSESVKASPAIEIAAKPTKHIQETLKKGDNLSMVFDRVGLNARDVYQVVESGSEGKALTRMFPGEQLEFVLGENDQLEQVIRIKSPLESIHFIRNASGEKTRFDINRVTRTPDVRKVYRSAFINDSLSLSAQRADVSQSITMNMANIFGGVIDFVLDVRNGDQFTVVYEEHYLDGEKIDEGNIIAAQYTNRGTVYNAFRYTDPDGDTGYYNEDGVSMRKAFLRAPLDFTRISSSFNLRRLHPITKVVKPHRGIDYAAPRGTPVFSAGDGRVSASGRTKANGNYVFIKHGESYTTKYLHLHRRSVKKGQRVKQGQIIGQVGCTGLCSGPHLHYEFLVNGVHRNPRTILKKLPKAKRLDKNLKSDFLVSIESTQLQLARYSSHIKLASAQ